MEETASKPTSATPQSFIVKFWLEEPESVAPSKPWRGLITHVPSGERQYLSSPGDMFGFMAPYLKAMGMALDWRWRWFGRWR